MHSRMITFGFGRSSDAHVRMRPRVAEPKTTLKAGLGVPLKKVSNSSTTVIQKIDSLKRLLSKRKVELVSYDRNCKDCDTVMLTNENGYVCPICGKDGGALETTENSIQITLQNASSGQNIYSAANGRFDSRDDQFNSLFLSTFNRLEKRRDKNGYNIPLDILRSTAYAYADLCQKMRENSAECPEFDTKDDFDDTLSVCSTQADDHEIEPAVKKIEKRRFNIAIPRLLQIQLDLHGMSKPDLFVCTFIGIKKKKLTKSKNKVQPFINGGMVSFQYHDRIPNFAYLFLSNLGISASYTDIIVAIIRRADVQVDMINYRTCQDSSKVVGSIWLLIRQLNIRIPHSTITGKCEKISKSTYMRYADFLDANRRRINPILVKARIRPIPISFGVRVRAAKADALAHPPAPKNKSEPIKKKRAAPKKSKDAASDATSQLVKKGRDSRSLPPIPEQYKGTFTGWP